MAIFVDIRSEMPRHPTRKWDRRKLIKYIVVHTTASSNQDPKKTARYHITPGPQNHVSQAGCPGLCYHDYINKDGIIFHCNEYRDKTWHAGLYNAKSIGVVMAFEGQKPGMLPSDAQWNALLEHLVKLCLFFKLLPQDIIGHREVPGMYTIVGKGSKKYKTVCPGLAIDLDNLRYLITCRLQTFLAAQELYTGSIDGKFGKLSQAALNNYTYQGIYAV